MMLSVPDVVVDGGGGFAAGAHCKNYCSGTCDGISTGENARAGCGTVLVCDEAATTVGLKSLGGLGYKRIW